MAIASLSPADRRDASRTTLAADGDGALLLDALDDEACRAILAATGDEAHSAAELSDACDIPLSTAYRKLELLADAGLLTEGIRIRRSGKHTSEYRRAVDGVHVAVGTDGGIELTLDHRAASA